MRWNEPGREIQNKINTHKGKVIHGHWHQDWEQHTVSQKSPIRETGLVPAGNAKQEGNGLSLCKRREPASLFMSGLYSLVRPLCWKKHRRYQWSLSLSPLCFTAPPTPPPSHSLLPGMAREYPLKGNVVKHRHTQRCRYAQLKERERMY